MMRKKVISAVLAICLLSCPVKAYPGIGGENNMKKVLSDLKKSVVFLGRIEKDGKPDIFATGFLVRLEGVYHLVTAKHVVIDPHSGVFSDSGLLVFFNIKGGGVSVRSIEELRKEYNIKWMVHNDPRVDIAIIPFLVSETDDDVMVVPEDLFLDVDDLSELDDVFFMPYQPGIEPRGRVTPVIRSGSISLIKEDRSFYIDAMAFPGNSGSPVFLESRPDRPFSNRFKTEDYELGWKFVGIIGGYVPYKELAVSAQTGRPRVMFEENTGLSRVWSASYIMEISRMASFKEQVAKLKVHK